MSKRVKLRGYLCTLYRYQPIKRDMNANPRHKIEDEVWHHSTKAVQNVQHHYDESDSLSHSQFFLARALSTKANVILKDAKD